jgi:tRNA pseudouridine38-40 synthase
MRYFIRLSFDGKPFHGWQIQKNANSVQQELNKALCVLLRCDSIETTGCGRTDTGVHALKFYAHFDHEEIKNASSVVRQLNSILPKEIAVQHLFKVGDDSHARFDAISRTYIYRIYHNKNPFLSERSFFFPAIPDVDRMNHFAGILLKHTDFSAFSKSKTQTHTNNCIITFARWEYADEELIFRITADRFLRNMVRAVTGTLLDAGTKKISEKDLEDIISSRSRSEAGTSVPAHGLYLADINYPYRIL